MVLNFAVRFIFCVFVLSVPIAGVDAATLKSMKAIKMQGLVRQTLDYSCGAAALSYLLKNYFGDEISEQEILGDVVLRLTNESLQERITDGFSMLDLKQSASRLGYSADGFTLPKMAINELKGPVIILLRRAESNHFVVLKGVMNGMAFLADPARGHVRIPLYSLFNEWKGEALILGRNGFGLPTQHGLSIPRAAAIASEKDTVRSLKSIHID